VQHETGVVQIQDGPVLSPRWQPLVDASVPAHDVAARAKREPEEVDPTLRSVAHGTHPRQSSTCHRDRQRPEWPGTEKPLAHDPRMTPLAMSGGRHIAAFVNWESARIR
jgi:hypothetical protein